MREFFCGWKRKAGCVTLLMACALAIGWVRSCLVYDFIMAPWGDHTFCIHSTGGQLDFARMTQSDNPFNLGWISGDVDWQSGTENGARHDLNPWPDHKMEWRWDWLGFHFGAGKTTDRRDVDFVFPYWSIVLPLTAISAWLLLSKPRSTRSALKFDAHVT